MPQHDDSDKEEETNRTWGQASHLIRPAATLLAPPVAKYMPIGS